MGIGIKDNGPNKLLVAYASSKCTESGICKHMKIKLSNTSQTKKRHISNLRQKKIYVFLVKNVFWRFSPYGAVYRIKLSNRVARTFTTLLNAPFFTIVVMNLKKCNPAIALKIHSGIHVTMPFSCNLNENVCWLGEQDFFFHFYSASTLLNYILPNTWT